MSETPQKITSFLLRMPKVLKVRIARDARQKKLSLNQYIVEQLSAVVPDKNVLRSLDE